MSSERPDCPRSACEIALGDTPANRGKVGLAEVSPLAQAAQRDGQPGGGRRRGQAHLAVVADAEGQHAALDARRAPVGLGDPHAMVVDHQHALRDLLDLATQRRERVGASDRPVGDGADLEQHRAAAHEEAAGDLDAPALGHGIERVEDEDRALRAPRERAHGREQLARPRARAVGRRVDDLVAVRCGDRLAAQRDVREGLGLPAGRDECAHERLDRRLSAHLPDHVVAPEQAAQCAVQVDDPAGCRTWSGHRWRDGVIGRRYGSAAAGSTEPHRCHTVESQPRRGMLG